MLNKLKESARDTAMFTLVGTFFFIFKVGETIYKLKKKLSKQPHVCLYCEEEIPRGGGVDLGDGEGICASCAKGSLGKKQYIPTFLRR